MTAAAKKAHALAALVARPRGWDVGGCVEVEVTYCRVTGHARDTDRVANLVLDALRGVAFADDNDSRVLASGSLGLDHMSATPHRRASSSSGAVPGSHLLSWQW